ncbi:MAG TPA: SRPBCC family protein [Abditibacteriaceae bacterium]|nr:SRPBCC family protein [Abditibacteriaceae bacterium]
MEASRDNSDGINVGQNERIASAVGGGVLALYGLTRRSWGGMALAVLGGSLIYRGATGHCSICQVLGRNTAEAEEMERHGAPQSTATGNGIASGGIRVEKAVTINKSPEELYQFWHNFENLPRFMNHLESVQIIDDKRSHWVAKAPAGRTVEWDAEITQDEENALIAWRSTDNADVPNSGTVRFQPLSAGRGTEVEVSVRYTPPGGVLGALAAKMFGEEPSQQIADDLRRFKQLMEAGEIATTEGQPRG